MEGQSEDLGPHSSQAERAAGPLQRNTARKDMPTLRMTLTVKPFLTHRSGSKTLYQNFHFFSLLFGNKLSFFSEQF